MLLIYSYNISFLMGNYIFNPILAKMSKKKRRERETKLILLSKKSYQTADWPSWRLHSRKHASLGVRIF